MNERENCYNDEKTARYEEKTGKRKRYGKRLAGVVIAIILAAGSFYAGYDARGLAQVTVAEAPSSYVHTAENSDSLNYSLMSTDYLTTSSMPLTGGYSLVYEAVQNSVVSINTTTQQSLNYFGYGTQEYTVPGAASGIIFYEDEERVYIVTNFHVVDGALSVTISLDDATQVPANYVGGDAYADIAVISVKKSDMRDAGFTAYKLAVFGDSDNLRIGDFAMAVGNAMGEGKSATVGIVSAKEKEVLIENTKLTLLQTDAAINNGNSGGALVNINGEVIGINTAKLFETGVEGMGYAIPANTVIDLIDTIMTAGTVLRPYLGISCEYITAEMVESGEYPAAGVLVRSIIKGYAADSAGVKSGDIITSFNGVPVTSLEHLTELIASTSVGDTVYIGVTRSTYQSNGFRLVFTGTEELVLSTIMTNYSNGPSF